MSSFMNLFATLSLDSSSFDKGLDKAGSAAKKVTKAMGSGLVKAAKAATVAITATTTAVTVMGKQAISQYARYEQLVGGVETLFKNADKQVIKNAENAYKTAGMSANAYMETVTSFAGSLLQATKSTTKKLTEEEIEARSDGLDKQYELQKKAYSKQYDSLVNAQDKALEAVEKRQEKEIEAHERATEKKIALIDKEYKENLKLIDEAEYKRIKSIDEKIAKINEEREADAKAQEQSEQAQRRAELIKAVNTARSTKERKEAEQALYDYNESITQKELEESRKKQIDELKTQKETIKEETKKAKEAARNSREAKISAIEEESKKWLKRTKATYKTETKQLKAEQKSQLSAYKEYQAERLKALKKTIAEEKKALKSGVTETEGATKATAESYTKAAEAANQALIDMADNANKMGTPMESIRNAYMGFSKQNYTMLDNLKLGYGGTKSEMERLLKDAQKLTGVKYDISKLTDVYEAIHAIQKEMGITGTTQKEAATTIEGSLNSTKAAWENVLTALAGGGNLSKSLDGLITSIFGDKEGEGLLNQIQPRIIQVFKGIGKFLKYLTPFIVENIPKLLKEIVPPLIKASVELFKTLPQVLSTLVPGLISAVKTLFKTVFGSATPDKEMFIGLATKLTYNLNNMLSSDVDWASIGETLSNAVDNVLTSIYTFLETVDWEQVGKNIGEFLSKIDWFQLLADLVLIIWAAVKGAWKLLVGFFDGLGVTEYWTNVLLKIGKVFSKIGDWIYKNVIKVVVDYWTNLATAIANTVIGIKNGIVFVFKAIPKWIDKHVITPISDFFANLWNGIKNGLKSVKSFFKSIFDGIWGIVKGIINTIIGGINTLWSGIYTVVSGIVNTLSSVAETAGDLLGQDWSFSMPEEPPLIPKLAKGAVIPKNYGEFPAILGDNKKETEIVSPLSTIKQAVKEAQSESGMRIDEYTLTKFAQLVAKYLSVDLYIDKRTLVGSTAADYSRALTKINAYKAKGGAV